MGLCATPVIWAGYRFSFAPIVTPPRINSQIAMALNAMSPRRRTLLVSTPVPAPEFLLGIISAYRIGRGEQNRSAYLLGSVYKGGLSFPLPSWRRPRFQRFCSASWARFLPVVWPGLAVGSSCTAHFGSGRSSGRCNDRQHQHRTAPRAADLPLHLQCLERLALSPCGT